MAVNKIPATSPAFYAKVTLPASTAVTVGTKLNDLTLAGVTPDMFLLASPDQALDAGIGVCAPYCTTAGTLVLPICNGSGSTVTTADDLVFTIIGL